MTTFKRITDLPLTDSIDKEDLFIVETATGTHSVKIETFKDTEVTKESIGLGNVDNTSDLNKPISTATQNALDQKVNSTDLADTYLTKTEATNTYLSQSSASGTYLTRANAQSTYLSKADASATYLTQTDASNTYASRSALDGKQNTLTAGANITISGSTISATDTQYTAGSNISISNGQISFTGEIPTKTSDLTNDSGFLTGITSSQVVTALGYTPYNSSNPNSYITRAGISTTATGLTYNNSTGILSLTGGYVIPTSTTLNGITTNATAISTINGKIPSQASTTNQLADKAFVNSTIQTATANFRGNWDTWIDVPTVASDYPEDYSGNKTPTNNDYIVVSDASGYVGEQTLSGTWRFKYTGVWSSQAKAGWLPEYQINEEPFTQAQQAAINSGITSTLVAQIGSGLSEGDNISLLNNDSNYQNATQVQTALSSYVPTSRKVNNKTLNNDIALTYSDVNALPNTTKYGASLSVSGKTIQLKDQDGSNLGSPITTQDTTYTGGTDITINSQNEISFTNNTGYITGINSSDVVNALGYSPYNATNPDGYQTSANVDTKILSHNNSSSAHSTLFGAKQDTISDLEDIRTGAGLGATAVQPATLNNYVPTSRKINGTPLTSDITIDALPSQTGQSGKFLTTDGSSASWESISSDGETITKNTDNELQAVGLVNKNTAGSTVYDWVGTSAQEKSLGAWTDVNAPDERIVYGNGMFLSGGTPTATPNKTIKKSTDGETWETIYTYTDGNIRGIGFCNGHFFITTSNNEIGHSTDGENWTFASVTGRPTNDLLKCFFNNNIYVITGKGSVYKCFSEDLINWEVVESTYSVQCFAEGKYWATTDTNYIYYSTDCRTWESKQLTNLPTGFPEYQDIEYVCGKFIIGERDDKSSNSKLFYTSDFETFGTVDLGTGTTGRTLTGNSTIGIIPVGPRSTSSASYFVTTDGINWQQRNDLATARASVYPACIAEDMILLKGNKAILSASKANPTWNCYITDKKKIIRNGETIADNTELAVKENTIATLTTTNKTVVGAINEVNGLLAGLETILSEV